MNATYDYFYQEMPTGQLDVEDIGNCCISANNDNAEFYYLIISTDLGVTQIIEYGPYCDGLQPSHISYSFQQFDYNETKLDKIINKFLNNPAKRITQAYLVDIYDIKNNLVSPMEYMNI